MYRFSFGVVVGVLVVFGVDSVGCFYAAEKSYYMQKQNPTLSTRRSAELILHLRSPLSIRGRAPLLLNNLPTGTASALFYLKSNIFNFVDKLWIRNGGRECI